VGIRFVDGKKMLKCCLHFYILILVVPGVLQLARLCMQFADSAGNIAAGALIQSNTFSFSIFITFLLFTERGKELFLVMHMQTLMLHHLKGLLASFSFRSKRYLIPFCSVQEGLDTACKIEKIRENKRVLHAVIKYLLAPFKWESDCLKSNCKRLSNTL